MTGPERFPLVRPPAQAALCADSHAGGSVRTIVNSRVMLVGLAMLATAGMAACSANQTPNSAGPNNGQTTAPAATAAASQPAAVPSPAPTGIQNLVISSAGKSDLT